MINYSAYIEGDFYGVRKFNEQRNKFDFVKKGKLLKVEKILKNLETGEVSFYVSFDYLGERETLTLPRSAFLDSDKLKPLVSQGVDISPRTKDVFVDSMRVQENLYEVNHNAIQPVFEKFGWIALKNIPHLCFRAFNLIGDSGDYAGDFKISQMGSFEKWRDMILDDVIGDTIAEITLLAALSSVLVPIISEVIDIGNPIIHLYGVSGSGKTTNAILGTSAGGEPFDGERKIQDVNGNYRTEQSIYQSWGATSNAIVTSCAGNYGYPIVLNELGKCLENDLTTVVYNLSEGTDKRRLTKDMKCKQSEGFKTAIISTGEHSLVGRCKEKADGLKVRVMELTTEKTPGGAERADRIKSVCQENNGFAIPMLAEYIIQNEKLEQVKETYRKTYNSLLDRWFTYPNYHRFVSKFAALYLTTAEVVKDALGIEFSTEKITQFILDYDKETHKERNSATTALETLLEIFSANQHRFVDGQRVPSIECWGKIEHLNLKKSDGRILIKKYLVFQHVLERLLKENGYSNINTCIKAWKKEGVLDFETGHSTRKRKIYPNSQDKVRVYVFNVYEEFDAVEDNRVKSKIVELTTEEGDDDDNVVDA